MPRPSSLQDRCDVCLGPARLLPDETLADVRAWPAVRVAWLTPVLRHQFCDLPLRLVRLQYPRDLLLREAPCLYVHGLLRRYRRDLMSTILAGLPRAGRPRGRSPQRMLAGTLPRLTMPTVG